MECRSPWLHHKRCRPSRRAYASKLTAIWKIDWGVEETEAASEGATKHLWDESWDDDDTSDDFSAQLKYHHSPYHYRYLLMMLQTLTVSFPTLEKNLRRWTHRREDNFEVRPMV